MISQKLITVFIDYCLVSSEVCQLYSGKNKFSSLQQRDRKEGNVSQQGQPRLTVAGFGIWIGTKLNILFCNGYNAPTLSQKSTQEVFYVLDTSQSRYLIQSTVRLSVSKSNNLPHSIEMTHPIRHPGTRLLSNYAGFRHVNLHQYPVSIAICTFVHFSTMTSFISYENNYVIKLLVLYVLHMPSFLSDL